MDWNVGPLQNTDAQNNLQSQEACYTQVLSNAQAFPQANAYSSENVCSYTGNNHMMYLPTSNINVVFTPVNAEGYKNSDQTFSGASVAGNGFAISEYAVDRCPPSHVPLATRPPNQASHVQMQITQNPWRNSKAHTYSRRKLAPLLSQMNSGNNVQNTHRESQNQYLSTNGYTVQPQVSQLNSMRTTMLYQSNRECINASKAGCLPPYNMNGSASSQGIPIPINQSSSQYTQSQNNSLSFGTSGQHVQTQIYYPSNQFQVSHSQSKNTTVNVPLQQYVPSQMGSETHNGCSAPSFLPASCDSRAQSLLGVQQAVQNVSNGYTLNHQKHPSDQNSASCFNDTQQYWQKQQSGEVSETVRNVCNLSGNVTANRLFNEMSTASTGISKELYNTVQEIATVPSVSASKPPNDTASVQEKQTTNLMNVPINSQMPSPTGGGIKITKDRLAWEAHKLLSIKKKCLLLERMLQYKKKLFAASEHDKSTSTLTPCNQNTPPNFLPHLPNQNVTTSVSETVRTASQQHLSFNSSPIERNDRSMTNVDNRGLEITQSNHQMEHGSFSSNSLSISAQSKLSAQLNNPVRAPILEQKDVSALTSSQKTLASSNNTSCCSQTDNPFKIVGKNIPTNPGKSSFLQFVLSSTNILKEKRAGATADKILTSLLCNEKPLVDLTGSDGSLLKDATEKSIESLKGEQAFKVHTNPLVSEAVGSDETSFQNAVGQEKTPFTENSCSEQNNCTYSVEELTACLGLWRKHATEPVNVQNSQSNESLTANPMSLLPYTQNAMNNREQNNVSVSTNEAVLPLTTLSVGQKHDMLCSNLIKSFELQVAVVSPLVLSKQKTRNEETDKFPTSAGTTYPVIEAGSICSLQEEGKNVLTVVNTDKGTKETVPSSPDDCVLIEEVDLDLQQTKSADGNGIVQSSVNASDACDKKQRQVSKSVQDARENLQFGLPDEASVPELGVNSSQIFQKDKTDHKDKQAVLQPGNTSTTVLEDVFHISSVCSLVEGDTFYNPQIASMFSSAPVTNTLSCGSSLADNASDPKQNEQHLDLCKDEQELRENVLQGEGFLQTTLEDLSGCMSKADKILDDITISSSEKASSGSSPKTLSTSEQKISVNASYKHPENDLEILASINQELTQNSQGPSTGVTAETNMFTVTRDSSKQGDTYSKNSTDEETNLFGGEPVKCLNSQLTELVEEFPYGIEGADMLTKDPAQSDFVAEWTENRPQKETQTCNQNSDPVDQIQITLLRSEQTQDAKDPAQSDFVAERTENQPQKETQTCNQNSDPVDQIKIPLLTSEQMQELFPEPNQHSYSESHKATSQQAEKDSIEKENLESNMQSDQSLCEEKEKTEKNSRREKKTYCCLMGWLSVEYAVPQCSCESRVSDSEKNHSDHQISEFENASSKEREESNIKSVSKTKMNCTVENLPTEKFQNNVGKNKKDYTSVMNKEARTKVNNEYKPLATQQEKIKPLNLSEKKDSDKLRRSNWKEELQIYRRIPSLGKEFHSAEKDYQSVSKEELLPGKAGCMDADNMMLPKKKDRVFRVESLSKDKTEINLAVKPKTDICKFKNSEIVEIKQSEVYEGHENITCEENLCEEQSSRKQKDVLGKEVGGDIRGKVKLSAEKKHKKLNSCRTDAIKFPNFGNIDLKSRSHKYSQHKSVKTLPSQESSYKRKRKENMIGNRDAKKTKLEDERLKQSETKNSKQLLHNHMINTDKTRKSNGENGWKRKSSLTDHSVLKLQKKRGRSSTISKNYFSNKERHLDGQNKDKSSEKMFSDKNLLFLNRRNNKLKMCLQKEPKKHYLNRVAFKRTAQESIYLTKLETSPVRPVWHMKPKVSQNSSDEKREASLSEDEKSHKLQVLEFKLCPEILFRNPATEEESSAPKNILERNKSVVAVEDSIPLDTAIQILEGDGEALHIPVKDSKEMFQTYRKMYLEKRCKSVDSVPVS
ncbi:retroelement silencing factor 1 isoform X2 [Rhea pennata]|uniref:retroelement silencing factor 1 isoform X2 n=1 Tax=Rhea pennata TaxID=8795 RepID=UPI002E2625B6